MMPHGQLSYTSDADGILVMTRNVEAEGDHPPRVQARVYHREYALVMTKSPALLGALK